MKRSLRDSLLLLASLCCATSAYGDEVKILGGKNLSGTLKEITDGEVTLKTDAGDVRTPLPKVLAVEFRAAKPLPPEVKYSAVRLLDDTVLQCKSAVVKGKEVEIALTSGANFKLPIHFVVSIFHDAGDLAMKKQWDQFGGNGAGLKRDRVFIRSGPDLNPFDGTLGEVDLKEGTIAFKSDLGDRNLKLEKVQGMFYYRTEVPPYTAIGRVIDVDGNMLVATKLGFDGTTLTLTTGFGATIPLAAAAIAKLDFNLGKLTYLSDMEPAGVIEKSGIGLVTRYKKDSNLDGEPILLEKQYTKGLSIHSHTELEYNLAGKYKEFKAILGVDTRTGADSKALVTIYCDGDKRFSEVVSIKASRAINLNVKDVATMRIVVSSQNFLDLHDHATLAEARVSQ